MPILNLAAGTFTSAQTLSISDTTSGASIYYTIDGTAPNSSSTLYSGPLTLTATETIEAIAVANGYSRSTINSATYKFPLDFTLSASPNSLTVNSGAQGSIAVAVTPQNGFNSAVSFECS